jgi:hypothetical protein
VHEAEGLDELVGCEAVEARGGGWLLGFRGQAGASPVPVYTRGRAHKEVGLGLFP